MTYKSDPGTFELNLIMNDSELNFSNKTFIFFTQQDGNYYFVERQTNATNAKKSVPLYAVPINKVKMANITRIIA